MKTKRLWKKIADFLLVSAVITTSSVIPCLSVSAAGITVDSSEALQSAIDSAGTDTATLTLTADITANSSIVIGKDQNITIDLGGFTLGRNLGSVESKGSVIIVEGGTLTVRDSSQEHTGSITGGASTDFGGGISCLRKEKIPSTLTLSDVTFKENRASSGGAVYADSDCTVTATGCIFESNSAEKGGAVTGIGNVTLDTCTVKNNRAELCGGGLYVNTKDRDKVIIKGKTVFSGNSSGTDGGAVYVESGKVSVSGASFTDNQAVVSGGAVVIAKTAEAELSKAVLNRNKCHKNGGAVFNEGNLLLKECSLTENSAEYGAGIYNSGSFTVTGTEITGNNCSEKGGGIFQNDGTVTLGGGVTKIKGNTKNDDENDQNDVAFNTFSKIAVTGKFERSTRIGLSLSDLQTEVTTGYGKNNTVAANNYFFMNNEEYRISPDSKKTEVVIEKDPNSVRNTTKTLVEVYSDEKRISKNEYGTPADAWSKAVALAASDKETVITLGGDWQSSEMYEIGSEKHITIDLNGHYIKRDLNYDKKSKGGLFTVKDKAVLTVKDSSPNSAGYDGIKGGVLTGGASSDTGGCFEITEKGKVIMNGGTIYDCITDEDGGAVRIEDGEFTLTGGRIYHCQTIDSADNCDGGAIFLDKGTVRLTDAAIDDCSSEDHGGAIYSDGGAIYLKKVTFSGNQCRDYGGAICLWDETLLEARYCRFSDNQTEEDGGAVYVEDSPADHKAILFDNCVFRGNRAGRDGGAFFVCDDGLALSNTEITKNSAKKRGGAVFVDSRYGITVRGLVTIKNNTCDDNKSMANLTLEDGTFVEAKIMNAGLYKGFYIAIGTTAGSGKTYLSNSDFSKYQTRYFTADEGKIDFSNYLTRYSLLTTSASIFGNGNVDVITCFGITALVLTVIVIVVKKKRIRAAAVMADNTDEESAEGGEEDDQN